jgi:hypothetical protein
MPDQPALFQTLISQLRPNQLCSEEVNIHLQDKPLSITTLFRPNDSFKIKELHYIDSNRTSQRTHCDNQSVNFV